jgi:hypothetical protein
MADWNINDWYLALIDPSLIAREFMNFSYFQGRQTKVKFYGNQYNASESQQKSN